MNNYLSKNFKYSEAIVSDSFPGLAKKIVLTDLDKTNIKSFAMMILQPIRDKFGPVNVSSWKRNDDLNKAVGGTKNSDHLYGCAADMFFSNINSYDVFKWIMFESGLYYKEAIFYPQKNNKFIHISMNNLYNSEEHDAFVCYNSDYISMCEYEKILKEQAV